MTPVGGGTRPLIRATACARRCSMLLSAIMMGSLLSEPQSDGDLLGASRKRSLGHIPPVIFNYINPWANPLLPALLHLSRLSRECLWVWLSPPTLRGLLGDFLFT